MGDGDKDQRDGKFSWKNIKDKLESNEKVQMVKDKINDPDLRQQIKDKGTRGSEILHQKFTEKKELAKEKIEQKIGDKSAKEVYEEMKESSKEKMQMASSKFSKQVRFYSVFGLSFSALLITRRITPSIFAFGLSTYFICPEIMTDIFKQK